MLGLMMKQPLLVSSILDHAAKFHGTTEIVSRLPDGAFHRYGYAEARSRAKRLAKVLAALGVGEGDRVATLAWNGHRHYELYYGVSGMGAVCHVVNPRLFTAQIAYIVNHAEDSAIFFDTDFVGILEEIAPRLTSVKAFVAMADEVHMPDTSLPGVHCYETLMAARDDDYEWPALDEGTASSMCYSSGTTGNPKGVLYTHRSTVLHAMATVAPDLIAFSARDSVMPAVPMFHVNAWGFPYAATMVGAKFVLPGRHLDGKSLCDLINSERVTLSAGVPTVWLGVLEHLERTGGGLECLERCVIGGSAVPRAMSVAMEQRHGVRVLHAWGMTEMSPIATINAAKNGMEGETDEERHDRQVKQGRPCFGVDLKIVDDDDRELAWDGTAFGEMKVRGLWVCSAYFRSDGDSHDAGGWFLTGDICTIDEDGYVHVTDRSKDVIKSGGEWISSIDLENIAVGHPDVFEAAVIGVAHPKWDERPLLLAVRNDGSEVSREELLSCFEGKVAKWWIPDDVVFVDELPHTATGKLLKMELRKRFANRQPPADGEGAPAIPGK